MNIFLNGMLLPVLLTALDRNTYRHKTTDLWGLSPPTLTVQLSETSQAIPKDQTAFNRL